MNINTAYDEILGLFRTAWVAGAGAYTGGTIPHVFWEGLGVEGEKPQEAPWARVTIRHASGEQATLRGDAGLIRWRRSGIITIQVFFPLKLGGLAPSRSLARVAAAAYEGASTAGGAWFRNVRVTEIGPDGPWYNVNALAEFEYDELS